MNADCFQDAYGHCLLLHTSTSKQLHTHLWLTFVHHFMVSGSHSTITTRYIYKGLHSINRCCINTKFENYLNNLPDNRQLSCSPSGLCSCLSWLSPPFEFWVKVMTLSSDEKCIGNIAHTQSEPITDINSYNGNNDERVSQVTSIFKTSKSHLQILDARRVTHSGFTNIRWHGTKFCCLGNLALAICAPLMYMICLSR